jgi:O-antigen/teichoic acid export membrane protein
MSEKDRRQGARLSVRRSAGLFFVALSLSHLSQFIWLAAGSRAMSESTFGKVLSAQVLYALLQIVVDNGTAAFGARRAARETVSEAELGQLVRLRLVLTALAVPVGLVIAAASGTLAATAPFMVALVGFALFNVWQPYGEGNPRPWASYMFGRSVLPAAVALGFAVAGASFPAPLAGALECVVLITIVLATGQQPLRDLRLALSARGGPWRSTLSIGVPAVIQQASLAAGTLALSVSGAARAAGVFAACVRLLTGLNALNGILATAMFPSLAEQGGLALGGRRVSLALRFVTALALGVTAVVCAGAGLIAQALLDHSSGTTESALVLTTAAGAATGTTVMLTYVLVAAGGERLVLPAYGAGSALTLAGAAVVVAAAAGRVDIVAAVLLAGQLVTMAGLVLATGRLLPAYGPPARAAGLGALALAVLSSAAVVADARIAVAVLLAAGALAAAWGGRREVLGLVRPGRRRRHEGERA